CLLCFATLLFISSVVFFFFSHTSSTQFYTLSLHDALPISPGGAALPLRPRRLPAARAAPADARADAQRGDPDAGRAVRRARAAQDRKSTRLNSSHVAISYAVFCLKKKKKQN